MSEQVTNEEMENEDRLRNPDYAAFIEVIDNTKRMLALKYRIDNTEVIRQDILREILLVMIDSYLTVEKKTIERLKRIDALALEIEDVLRQGRYIDHINDKATEALHLGNEQQSYLMRHMLLITSLLKDQASLGDTYSASTASL